jgi:hypothetical protein
MSTTTRSQSRTQNNPPQNNPPDPQQGGGGGGDGGNGGGGAPGDNPPGAPGNNPAGMPFNFALTPALATNAPLDFSRPEHVKLYRTATAPLDDAFDLTGDHLKSFVEQFQLRAFTSNWEATLAIPINGVPHDLARHYGHITLEQVRAHVLTYSGTQTRNAQNAVQIAVCLSSSLTPDARNKLQLETDKFTVHNQVDGLLMFRMIVGLAQIDTRATVSVVRNNLTRLDTKVVELEDNITSLNEFVKSQMAILRARGETTNDLLTNLFKGYRAVKDQSFLRFVERLQDDYNRGQDITPETLMEEAENKYKSLVQEDSWKQPTDQDRQIVALTAQLEKLQKTKNIKRDGKKDDGDNKKGKNKGNKRNNKKDKNNKWRPPDQDEKQPRTINGKEYWYCPNHGKDNKHSRWVNHKPEVCRSKPEEDKDKDKKDNNETQNKNQLKVASMAVLCDEDDDF